MSASIESVQLAPDGVVTDIYPAEGNETGKIDSIHDKDRGEIRYARDNHTVITQGPFELKQGDCGCCNAPIQFICGYKQTRVFLGIYHCYLRVPIFSQTRFMLFQILDMNIEFQRRLLPVASHIRLFISQMVR